MFTRRSILRRGAVAASGLTLAGNGAATQGDGRNGGRRPEKFVERDGTQLTLAGESFYFNGTNNFWLSDLWTTEDQVTRFFEAASELGIDAVRTWLFGAEPERTTDETHQLQPTAEHIRNGTIAEAGGEHFDHVIDQAAKHGVRLVFALTNYWGDYGGMQAYLDHSETAPDDYETPEFYTDPDAREYYRRFVETMLTRENTITGTTYREDPTIMIWELANEPRVPGLDDGVAVLGDWISEASSHVKDLDSNHLVSTGSEGFYADSPAYVYTRQGWEGQSFPEHHAIDTIDVCSFHLYPNSWGKSDVREWGTHWIREHLQDARERVGKPAYLGEFGVEVDREAVGGASPEAMARRNRIYAEWYKALERLDADGALLWQFTLDERMQYNDGHYVVDDDERTVGLLEMYDERTDLKSGEPVAVDRQRREDRLQAFGDYRAPPAPANVTATAVRPYEADVTWDPVVNDRTGLSHYQAYVDGEPTAAFHPDETSGTVWGLGADSTHELTATAVDNVGNESDHSYPIEVTTPAASE